MSTASLDSLAWVKTELERGLEAARSRLGAYAEEPGDAASFDEFIARIHETAGIFAMLEVPGGLLLAGQIEALALAVRAGGVPGDLDTFELLMRACLELSDYLESLLFGLRDASPALLAITNEVRARLGEDPVVRERVGGARPRPVPSAAGEEELAELAARLRPDYQAALLGFYRGKNATEAVARMARVVNRLESAATNPAAFELLWIAGGLHESLADGGLTPGRSTKKVLGQFERELKRLADGSEEAWIEAPPNALADRMLAEIEHSHSDGERVAAIRAAFHLESEGEPSPHRAAVPGSTLLASAGGAILEDLTRARDRIDIFVRTGRRDAAYLEPLDGMLKKVGDALDMLGLETARLRVGRVRAAIRRLGAGDATDEATLLGLATGLIGVESDVEVFLAGSAESPAALAERSARIAGLREILADISRIKETFSEYLRDSAPLRLGGLPRLAATLADTLDFLALADAAALMRRIGRYIEHLAATAALPERVELDRLADAVVSVEYWLETVQRGRDAPVSILENADRALRVLEASARELPRAAIAPDAAEIPESVAEGEPNREPEPEPERESEPESEPPSEPQAETPVAPAAAPPDAEVLPPIRQPGADPEIVAVFMDEAAEVNETLAAAWPAWQTDPDNREALAVIRRSFHTLKGSGRMVGARRLGEFAWAVESLLNRVIDYTLAPAPAIVAAVGEAVSAARELLGEFDAGTVPTADVQGLFSRVRSLARGEGLAGGAAAGVDNAAADETVSEPPGIEAGPQAESAPEPATEAGAEPGPKSGSGPEIDETALVAFTPIPRIDPILYRIYRRETEGHLAAMEDWLDAAVAADTCVSGALRTAVRALAGSAGMAGVDEMAALLTPLDAALARLGEDETALAGELPARVAQALAMARALLDAYGDGALPLPPWVPVAEELEAFDQRIETLRRERAELASAGVQPESESESEVNTEGEREQTGISVAANDKTVAGEAWSGEDENYEAEIVQVFVAEAGELLDGSEAAVHVWSGDHESAEPLAELLRRLHTLKGGARMAGAATLGDLTHELESLLIRVADGRVAVSGDLLHLVERALDRLHQMLTRVAGGGMPPSAPAIIAELRGFASGEIEAARAEEDESAAAGEAGAEREAAAEPPPGAEPADDAEEAEESWEEAWPEAPRLRHEMTRVRADLLEAAINNAGEVSIYRARIEQQLINLGVHVSELDRTVERLRNQLRELELETETQILSSYEQHPGAADRDFDPLELDRYTRIHELSRSLAEAVADLSSLRSLFTAELRQSNALLSRQGRVNADLQDALMRTRMVPFALSAPRLRRVVRRIAEEDGKRVAFEIRGAGGEMDRQLIGHVLPALEHLLRNAVVHGIEAPALRAARGKSEEGHVLLTLRHEGGDMLIEVSDDGGGLDLAGIRARAIEEGFIEADAELADEEIAELVFQSGITTAANVTQSAGRGVGMDVVAAEARQIGGSSEIHSTPGSGTRCRLRIPVTLAITEALLVRVGRTRYPAVLASIGAVARLPRPELERLLREGEPGFEYGGERYELVSLMRILGEEPLSPEEQPSRQPLLLVNTGGRRVALIADDMEGSREIVVKPVGPQIARVPGFAGATIFGDGAIGLLLDLSALVRALPQEEAAAQVPIATVEAVAAEPAQPLVMVVDDSITVRRVTQRLLERNGARVLAARDGLEALELLQDQRPDTMLLDLEMPRMDGYELAGHMKNDPRLRDIPIIVITSRSGEKHRERAEQIGIEHYLGKPWQDAALLDAIRAVVPRFAPATDRGGEDGASEDRAQGE